MILLFFGAFDNDKNGSFLEHGIYGLTIQFELSDEETE